jgi:ubiquinone/menaquinone biosynthesis C-methylase UbiE
MSDLYSKYASEYAELIKKNIYNALYDRPSLLALLNSEKFDSCLDIGCGPGAYISSLKKICKSITAIDQSVEFIEILKRDHPEIKSYSCNLEEGLKHESSDSFDLVISALTIHYIKDFKALFSEINRVLKSGGVFVFSTHHPFMDFDGSISKNYFELEKLTQIWNTVNKPTEVTFYRRPLSDLLNPLIDSNFIIEKISEGLPSKEIKIKSERQFEKLTTRPQFLFVRVKKIN